MLFASLPHDPYNEIYARPGRWGRRPYNKFVGSLYILNEKSD
jgi:hypothetical protein